VVDAELVFDPLEERLFVIEVHVALGSDLERG